MWLRIDSIGFRKMNFVWVETYLWRASMLFKVKQKYRKRASTTRAFELYVWVGNLLNLSQTKSCAFVN